MVPDFAFAGQADARFAPYGAASCPPSPRRGAAASTAVTRAFVTRFPLSWIAPLTGDALRVATTITDRGRAGRGCFASDQTIADALGISRSAVQSAHRQIERLEDGGASKTETSGRSTLTRYMRPLRVHENGKTAEPYVETSARARNEIKGNRYALYSYAAYCADVKKAVKVRCTSPSAGCCAVHVCALGEDTARALLRGLEADRWITQTQAGGGRRKGAFYDVHPVPAAAGNPPDSATANPEDRATTNPPDSATQNRPHLTGFSEQAREDSCGSAGTASSVVARGPVENSAAGTFEQAVASDETATPEPPKKSPITISATAYRVLRLLPLELSAAQYALASKAIEEAVAKVDGDAERIATRVHRNLVGQDVRDPYGWLISRGLRNSPCPEAACEEGFIWPSGGACRICTERRIDRRGTPLLFRSSTPVFASTWCCSVCERTRPGEAAADGVCGDCRAEMERAAEHLAEAVDDAHHGHKEWNSNRAAEVRAGIRRSA
ncbi:hypothetical protein [Streptomyces sp. IMTB 1903]|uniref:hypothetical protein n=1 Tax=Streptomyces sp. IMTB 1903 TaxID=1776680 RepID=UPI00075A0381|nr:hypothetical protein [Streptomyces sp. IMTB 1903]